MARCVDVSLRTLLIFMLFGVLLRIRVCHTLPVTLLDTAKETELNWDTYQSEEPGAEKRQGWREASYPTEEGQAVRIYMVCGVAVTNVENWLRTPFIPRNDAHLIYVNITFTLRRCNKYPEPERLQQCKESFQLLAYETDHPERPPPYNISAYRHIDAIAADKTFTEAGDAQKNTDMQAIAVSKKGVYFAFFDAGACITFLRVHIYYKQCPEVTHSFAHFPVTTTGPALESIVRQMGVCVPHAAIEQPPQYMCKANGVWQFPSGGCKCMPGYQPDRNNTACAGCPLGTYKWRTGSQPCRSCPAHSDAIETGAVECRCVEGYYRNINDDKSMQCTKPPSKVRNLTVTYHDQSMVNLSWQQPRDLGGRRDLSYHVECIGGVGRVAYRPQQSGFNSTRISLLGLEANTRYKVIVHARNGVSEQSRLQLSSHLIVKTDAALPSRVKHLRLLSVGREHVSLAWDSPLRGSVAIDKYEVKYHIGGATANTTSEYTAWRNITLSGLIQSSKYYFKVRGRTTKGWGEFSEVLPATTGQLVEHREMNKVDKQPDSQVGIIAGAAVAVVVCMVIVIIMVVIFIRRNHRGCNEKSMSDCDNLQYPNASRPLCSTAERAHKTYIDPHTYEDPNQAVREFAKEINASLITIEFVIGGGEFGDVCKGKLQLKNAALTVAIKTLKAGASSKNRLDFLTEASIMGQFDDPNVIFLVGVVTKKDPIMIITEYMENGSLDEFLRKNPQAFMMIQLVGMLRGIASGCRHLTDMHYVHRDLAARNILVNDNLVCKVSDFGLSREIETGNVDGAYTAKGGKIPVRWTAPEAIAFRKFSSASDVWSFGVVTWEVLSYGGRPYGNWTNQEVIKSVDNGFRLPPPPACPQAVHQLMLDCWQKEPANRPKFASVVHILDCLIRAPEHLRTLVTAEQSSMPSTVFHLDSVSEWLARIKMDRYAAAFERAGVLSMQRVAALKPADLHALGVTLVGHQKKIMNDILTLRAQLNGTNGGCLV